MTTTKSAAATCVCHEGSVCTEGCERGLHHDGCGRTAEPTTDEATPRVTIVKCPCGHEGCHYYGLSDGVFYQGNGFTKERAQRYADAFNAFNPQRDAAFEAIAEAASVLVTNAELTPDIRPQWQGAVDCYNINPDDLDALRAALAEANQ